MNNPAEILPGAIYEIGKEEYEVVTVTPSLVSLRGTMTQLLCHYCPDDFALFVATGKFTKKVNAPSLHSAGLILSNPDSSAAKAAHRKFYYVKRLKELFGGMLPRKKCQEEIEKIAAERNEKKAPSYTSIVNWTRKCNERGWFPLSLVKHLSRKKRGKILYSEVQVLMEQVLDAQYLKLGPKITMKVVFASLKGELAHENLQRISNHKAPLKLPSLRTLYRTLRRLNAQRRDNRTLGDEATRPLYRMGGVVKPTLNLLEQVQADSYSVDLMVVDDEGTLLGRVVHLLVLIEVSTRKVIGYDLSLIPPCAEKFLRALRMAIEAVPGEESERGLMIELVVDSGVEFANERVHHICRALGITIRFVPLGNPDSKPHIERFFGTLNTSLIHMIPGTTLSNPDQLGDYVPAEQACITPDGLVGVFGDWLNKYYHVSTHSGLNMPPNEAWRRALEKQLPPQKVATEELNGLFTSIKYVSLNGGVAKAFCLSWWGPALPELYNKLRKGQKAILYYDCTNLGQVEVAHPDRPNERFHGYASNTRYQTDLTLFEHKLLRKQQIDNNSIFSDHTAVDELLSIRKNIEKIKKAFQVRMKKNGQPKQRSKPEDVQSENTELRSARFTSIFAGNSADSEDNSQPFEIIYSKNTRL